MLLIPSLSNCNLSYTKYLMENPDLEKLKAHITIETIESVPNSLVNSTILKKAAEKCHSGSDVQYLHSVNHHTYMPRTNINTITTKTRLIPETDQVQHSSKERNRRARAFAVQSNSLKYYIKLINTTSRS